MSGIDALARFISGRTLATRHAMQRISTGSEPFSTVVVAAGLTDKGWGALIVITSSLFSLPFARPDDPSMVMGSKQQSETENGLAKRFLHNR